MKVFNQFLCLFNIFILSLSQEVSIYEKARLRIRNILHGYAERSGANFEPRKLPKNYETVSCIDDFDSSSSCASDKDKYLGNMYKSYLFRVNQLENTDQKLKRTKIFFKRLGSKGENSGIFKNTSLWLKAVVGWKNNKLWFDNVKIGGDVQKPECINEKDGQSVKTLFDKLSKCNETILNSCTNETIPLEYFQDVIDECTKQNSVLIDKVDECSKIDEDKEQDKCVCFGEADDMIEEYKSQKYSIQTLNSTEERNCIQAVTASSAKVKDKYYKECIVALRDCKKEEDTAISVINACQTGTSRGLVVVSHYRSFIEDLEDEAQQDAEDMEYYDYDY